MTRRRIKIEFTDEDGGRYTISLDGSISREKVLKVVDLVDIMGGSEEEPQPVASKDSKFYKIYDLIEKKFPLGSFASPDLLEAYEDQFNKPIRMSTVSTYLARLSEKGLLKRQKTPDGWMYRRVRISPTTP